MSEKEEKRFVNMGIFAHVDAGKTTISEQLLYHCGEIRRAGRVDEGTAVTDSLAVERRRGISVKTATVSLRYRDLRINLIDTPGHADFAGEVERALSVIDAAVLVLSAVEGIQPQTELIWSVLKKNKLPTLFFINKIDRMGADSARVREDIRRSFTPSLFPLNRPVGEGESGAQTEPLSLEKDLIEAVCATDDGLLEDYLADRPIAPDRLYAAAARAFAEGALYPVLVGSAVNGVGVADLLEAVYAYFPSPRTVLPQSGEDLSALVYKIEFDRSMGRIAHTRLFSGELSNRDSVFLPSAGGTRKISQIRRSVGGKIVDVGHVGAGDIASLCGLGEVRAGDILGSEPPGHRSLRLASPLLKVRVYPEREDAYPALAAALGELCDEDPLLDLEWLSAERELRVSVMGSIQIEVLESLLAERYGIRASFGPPTVIYKETPRVRGFGFDAYTMPKPCWAVLRFLIEPMERGYGFSYEADVPSDKMFYRYQEHVRKAVPGCLKQGLSGWEVTDLRVTLVDGEHHTIHTHPLDFFTCTPMAMRNGFVNCGMRLLEPYFNLRVTVPEEYGGRILHDFHEMRGEYDTPVIGGGRFTVEGRVPVAESLDYPVRLGASTGGRGSLSVSFHGYRECPEGFTASVPYRGVDPLDRAKYILHIRGAIQ